MVSKDITKKIRIPACFDEYIKITARLLNISENDAIKMVIFDHMRKTRYRTFEDIK